jgi:GNAT superfamily N-acetyltransferase
MMKMWRPEPVVLGPERATVRDISALNRVFAESFTDRYRRDGMAGVRVPELNPQIWRYALEDAGEGAMLWRDDAGDVIAFNIAHRSGVEGWMGPLAVRPDRQREGLGKSVVRVATDWLRESGVRVLGLETMPRTLDNIGFYSRLGFLPSHLTVTLTLDVPRRTGGPAALLSQAAASSRTETLDEMRALTHTAAAGYDFSREVELTMALRTGDTTIVTGADGVVAFGLWHSAPLADGRGRDELRVLKLVARDLDAFDSLLQALEASTRAAGLRRLAIRCQSRYGDAYAALVRRGYVVRWTDLRMTFEGFGEPKPSKAILFSNWEI